MEAKASSVLQAALLRKAAQSKYNNEVYGPEQKTNQSGGIRVDKRKFNKGRPRKNAAAATETSTVAAVPLAPAPKN